METGRANEQRVNLYTCDITQEKRCASPNVFEWRFVTPPLVADKDIWTANGTMVQVGRKTRRRGL